MDIPPSISTSKISSRAALRVTMTDHTRYCLVFEDDFSGVSLDASKWSHEVQVGGFGNGEFEWATADGSNTVVKDGKLSLKVTQTSDVLQSDQILNGYTLNLTADGSCTSTAVADCVVTSNSTLKEIINPVRSARISTKGKASIKYGRVEVVARLPIGDWLWPAIWMLPTDNVYGDWPASGEIDIVESRGNDMTYGPGGSNQVNSALHWGPETDLDMYYKTTHSLSPQRTDFGKSVHTFGLEWTEDHLFTYVDNKLVQIAYVKFNEYFWKRGNFPAKNYNNTALVDIWSQTGHESTPFDQSFYLILSLAVGGTNGWFQDIIGNKPWVNDSPTAKLDFYKARDKWEKTWSEASSLDVQSVKMWQQCD